MTENGLARRQLIRVLVVVSSLAVVLVFFVAPVIPVDIAYSCFVGGPPSLHYTDWQSPSYYLFQIGYHYTPPHVLCQ